MDIYLKTLKSTGWSQMVMERDLQLQERQMMAARERESDEAFEAMETSNRAKASSFTPICRYKVKLLPAALM